MQESVPSHRANATQDFLISQDFRCSWFHQCWSMGTTLTRLEPFKLFSLGHLARICVWGATWTVCKVTWTWESNTTKMKRDRWPIYKEGHFAVEKAFSSSRKTGWGPIQHIFSWTLVKAADNWLNTLWLFCILTFSTTVLSILGPIHTVHGPSSRPVNTGSVYYRRPWTRAVNTGDKKTPVYRVHGPWRRPVNTGVIFDIRVSGVGREHGAWTRSVYRP